MAKTLQSLSSSRESMIHYGSSRGSYSSNLNIESTAFSYCYIASHQPRHLLDDASDRDSRTTRPVKNDYVTLTLIESPMDRSTPPWQLGSSTPVHQNLNYPQTNLRFVPGTYVMSRARERTRIWLRPRRIDRRREMYPSR